MPNTTLESLFGDEKIDIDCPQCQNRFKVKFKQVAKDGSIVSCPSCHTNIELRHDDTTKKTLTDADKASRDFEKTLNQLDKTFKKFGK
ncbi:MJ0042-type zinc finger domain-containing protein [Paenibacillus sp. GYB004]|uniref:MJ0042-type zinc finger domain-containing protein n=1 Tax=Paenibacillus sp. GYB004 TaxID=2994393 RepID=UPI003FA73EEE